MAGKELTISMKIPLNGNEFEQAKETVAAGQVMDAIREKADQAFGVGGYELSFVTNTRRAPRAAKATDGSEGEASNETADDGHANGADANPDEATTNGRRRGRAAGETQLDRMTDSAP